MVSCVGLSVTVTEDQGFRGRWQVAVVRNMEKELTPR